SGGGIGMGSRRGLCGGSRGIAGRCILKPRNHSTTEKEQNEKEDTDDEADAIPWAVVLAVQHCKEHKSFDRAVNHTGLAVRLRKAVYQKGVLVRHQKAVNHTWSAVVVAVQQYKAMTQQ